MSEKPELASRRTRPFINWLWSKPSWVRVAYVYGMVFFGCLVLFAFLAGSLSKSFLVSQSYGKMTWPWFALLGFALGFRLAIFAAHLPQLSHSTFRHVVGVVAMPFMVAISFNYTLTYGVPIIAANIVRTEMIVKLHIDDPMFRKGKGCQFGVSFEEQGVNYLCQVSTVTRDALRRGQAVSVHGYGTKWGMFVTSIEPLPN